MDNIENESELVLAIAAPKTVTVSMTCQQFGDNDAVIDSLKLKVTYEKTDKDTWDREAEEADASLNESGQSIMLRRKVKNIVGLPLSIAGQPVKFADMPEKAMDLVLKQSWIADDLMFGLRSINQGRKSDTMRRMLLKN